MKKIVIACLFFLIAGCTPSIVTIPDTGNEITAGIGDVFFSYSLITPLGNSDRFDLTIVELNDEEFGILYNEYIMQSPLTSRAGTPTGWLIKQGFTKRFDYPLKELKENIIRFKNFEFAIVSISGGQITYKRVK